jgi:hypothetical protein
LKSIFGIITIKEANIENKKVITFALSVAIKINHNITGNI